MEKTRSKNDDNMKMLIGFQRTSARHSLAKQIHSDNELKTVEINYILWNSLSSPNFYLQLPWSLNAEHFRFSIIHFNNAAQLNQFSSSVPEKKQNFLRIVHVGCCHRSFENMAQVLLQRIVKKCIGKICRQWPLRSIENAY